MMKAGLVLAAVLVGAATGLTQTAPLPAPREAAWQETVSVSGMGRATVTPDRVVFSAGVQSMGPNLAAAVQENNARVSAIIAALRQLGVANRDIRTSQLSIYPQQDHQEGRRPRIVGYQVANTVTVTHGNPADVGRLLQATVDAGANTVSGVSFMVSDPAKGREGALQAAVADARAKAEILARAAGRTVGRALSITEGGAASPPVPMPRMAMMESRQADMPVEPGAEEMTFTVIVIFELR